MGDRYETRSIFNNIWINAHIWILGYYEMDINTFKYNSIFNNKRVKIFTLGGNEDEKRKVFSRENKV